MPKVQSESAKLRQFVEEFSSDIFKTDGKILYCIICDQAVPVTKRFQVVQHLNTGKHNKNINLKAKSKQSFIKNTLDNQNKQANFPLDLCQAMLESDIPLWKLSHPSFKNFLEKYTGKCVPDQSIIRKNYVSSIYENTISRIRSEIGDGPIWVSIDETTDVDGRYVCNVIVGLLHEDNYSKPYLLMCEELEKCNFQTIGKIFNDAMHLLWPSGVKYEEVLLFVSDAAPYMVQSANSLTMLYPNLIHLTCLAHGIHRISECLRNEYSTVDKLIASIKKVFLKAPSRIIKLRELFPNLPLPPQPIITRWGTWLNAVEYYSNNFDSIKSVISNLDDEAESIKKSKELFEDKHLQNDLTYLKSNFCFLIQTITNLEKSTLSLDEGLNTILNVKDKLNKCNGRAAELVKTKMDFILKNNKGFKTLLKIHRIINGEYENEEEDIDINLTPGKIASFKYAPVTSCDVERSFSQYKSILRSNRRSFIFENLKQHIIVACNNIN